MLRLRVPNMTCGGCARSVTRAVQRVDANARVDIDVPAREVRVQTTADEQVLLKALEEAGYHGERLAASVG